jgi:type I site-specific restriction-modification system R (restriction) subunit
MQKLAFNKYSLTIKSNENKRYIFDPIRKKFVRLTSEEWVRQHVIRYLLDDKKAPKSWVNVEKQFTLAGLNKRFDVIVFSANGGVQVLVECKAPSVSITQDTFNQIARYNMKFNAKYMMITNGLNHYYCSFDYENQQYYFCDDLPILSPN